MAGKGGRAQTHLYRCSYLARGPLFRLQRLVEQKYNHLSRLFFRRRFCFAAASALRWSLGLVVGPPRSRDGSAKSGEMSAAIRKIMRSLNWGQENLPGAVPALVAQMAYIAAGRIVVSSPFHSNCSFTYEAGERPHSAHDARTSDRQRRCRGRGMGWLLAPDTDQFEIFSNSDQSPRGALLCKSTLAAPSPWGLTAWSRAPTLWPLKRASMCCAQAARRWMLRLPPVPRSRCCTHT